MKSRLICTIQSIFLNAIVLSFIASASAFAQQDEDVSLSFDSTANVSPLQIERGRLKLECDHPGISRITTYEIWSADIPVAFDYFRIAFVADTHYPSRFTDETMHSLANVLDELRSDILLLGGDYQEDISYTKPLMDTIMEASHHCPAYAILGNNDIPWRDSVVSIIRQAGIVYLRDSAVTIERGDSHITLCGIAFSHKPNFVSPSLGQPEKDFVIQMVHVPDFAETHDTGGADLTLAAHTHGGQVTVFGMFAPVTSSKYCRKFLKGLNYNSKGHPVITNTGIGTSRINMRAFAPSEVVLLTLRTWRTHDPLSDKSLPDVTPKPHRTQMNEIEEEELTPFEMEVPKLM